MADTTTTNKGFVKPEINASIDTWGNKLNADLDQLDGYFELGGGLKLAQGGTGATTAAGARTNLGLGDSATRNVGTGAGTVAAGDLTVPLLRAHTTGDPNIAPYGSSGGDANIDGAVRGWNWWTRRAVRGGTEYGSQLAISDTEGRLLFRALAGGIWGAFRRVLTDADIGPAMTGSLGLGVIPSEKLDVAGSIVVRGNILGPSTGHAYTISANPAASVTTGGFVQVYGSTHAAPSQVVIGTNGAGRITVKPNGSTEIVGLTAVKHGTDADSSSAHFIAGNSGRSLNTFGRLTGGAYNPAVQPGDTGLITTGPTIDSTSLFIGTHASTVNGVRITASATILQGNAKLRLADGSEPDVGFRGAPINYQPNDYTFALTDAGKTVVHNTGAPANTYIIPTMAAVALPLGSTIVVRNRQDSGVVTIAPAVGVTLRQAGNTNTGNRSVAANGLVTLLKEVADEWVVSGAGLS